MPLWTLIGLQEGQATLDWPEKPGDNGQKDVLGMPRFNPDKCLDNCSRCVSACLPKAITRDENNNLTVNYGSCINCQLCTEVCPTNALTKSEDWAFGVFDKNDLIWNKNPTGKNTKIETKKDFQHSLHIRHVDAGSCNGCESELIALTNSVYDMERLGIFFTPTPRKADLLLVTGPVTYAMQDALLAAYEAIPKPCWVMAVGTCAVSGGSNGGGYAAHHGLENILPVDLYLPGCPPNPAALITALLMFLGKIPQKIKGGQYHDTL